MKFSGFYGCSPKVPRLSIPIFKNEDGILFRQISDDGSTVASLCEFQTDNDSRIKISNVEEIRPPKIGDKLIYAIEYRNNAFAVGDLNKIRVRLNELYETNQFNRSPFFALEVATFLDDFEKIQESKHLCYEKLSKINTSVAALWSAGLNEKSFEVQNETRSIDKNFEKIRISLPRTYINKIDANAKRRNQSRHQYVEASIEKYFTGEVRIDYQEFMDFSSQFSKNIDEVRNFFDIEMRKLVVEKFKKKLLPEDYIEILLGNYWSNSQLYQSRAVFYLPAEVRDHLERYSGLAKRKLSSREKALGHLIAYSLGLPQLNKGKELEKVLAIGAKSLEHLKFNDF